MSILSIQHVSKTFGSTKVLDDISLSLDSNEIFGFLGPNGAGKSTTIRCVMGYIYPEKGSILVNDIPVDKSHSHYRSLVGYVPSDLQLNENWTGNDHIQFISSVRNLSDTIDDDIQRLNFDPSKQVKHLSTGNKQKLAFLLAIMVNPKILILDEPTKGLDPILQEELYKMLLEFKNQGNTVFFSSHNLTEVERLCDRIALIRKGKIVTEETMESIHSKQVHVAHIRAQSESALAPLKQFGDTTSSTPDSLTLRISGDINPFLRAVAAIDVVDFSIEHANLEEIFLHYYEEQQ